MGSSLVKAVFDKNILVDLLKGRVEANNEPGRYSALAISRISWIEVLAGVRDTEDQNRVENLLGFFEIIELDEPVAREAIALRQQHRLKLPDAIIWASTKLRDNLFVTRNWKDFRQRDSVHSAPGRRTRRTLCYHRPTGVLFLRIGGRLDAGSS
jgi:predicted nucleic acid-binding protein